MLSALPMFELIYMRISAVLGTLMYEIGTVYILIVDGRTDSLNKKLFC